MPTGPIPILEDNTGAIKWAKDDGMTSGRRHVRIEYHYSVEESRNGNVDLRQISSAQNAAGGFTKPLSSEQFSRFIQLGFYDDNTAL
ncbi:putative nonribosomal peptide synthase [Erysiphe necator]|uniref:Putative nonribosomal peptide synthase n=1 Tax=Uncinula necator TaxID=52586 RepID=A0A0B1P4G4_UNCNE|nr:putative nonribosomal peptide synthase [Erysiphe necator]